MFPLSDNLNKHSYHLVILIYKVEQILQVFFMVKLIFFSYNSDIITGSWPVVFYVLCAHGDLFITESINLPTSFSIIFIKRPPCTSPSYFFFSH